MIDQAFTGPEAAPAAALALPLFARVALNGHQDLGVCALALDTTTGLFRATRLEPEDQPVVWFPRGSIFSFEETTAEAATAAQESAARYRAEEQARRAREQAEKAARLERVRGLAASLVAHFDGRDIRIVWEGAAAPRLVRDVILEHVSAKGLSVEYFDIVDDHALHSGAWWNAGPRAAIAAFVRELGGRVDGEVLPASMYPNAAPDDADIPF